MKRPKKNNGTKAFSYLLWSIPFSWVTGLSLLTGYAYAVYGLTRLRKLSIDEILLFLLAASLVASTAIAAISGSNQFVTPNRILSSLFNVSIVALLIGSYRIGRMLINDAGIDGIKALQRPAVLIMIANTLLVLFGWAKTVGTTVQLSYPALVLGNFPDLPGILRFHSILHIASIDWGTGDPTPRPFGFGIYHTEGAILYAMFAAIGASLFRRQGSKFIFIAISFAGLLLIASRTVFLAYAISFLFSMILVPRKYSNIAKQLTYIGIPIAIIIIILLIPALSSLYNYLVEYRAGSSNTRFTSYSMAISLVLDHNVLTGLGVKPQDDEILGIPIGSHSAFISLFTKGGLISLSIFLTFYVRQWLKVANLIFMSFRQALSPEQIRAAKPFVQCSVISLTWMITQDIDAVTNGGAFAFTALGITAAMELAARHSRPIPARQSQRRARNA